MSGRTLYRIRNFAAHFEKAESRKLKGAWGWVPLPCKLDGKGYRRLIRHGAEYYGCWITILIVAVKCKPAGTLQDEDGPLSAADISDKSGMPIDLVTRTLDLVTSQEYGIGWLESLTSPGAIPPNQDGALLKQDDIRADQESVPQIRPTGQDRTEQNQTGQNRTLNNQTTADAAASGSGVKANDDADGNKPRKPKGSVFTWLKDEDLRDTAKLIAWHNRASSCKNPVVGKTTQDQLNVVAAAVRSLQKADEPLKLFAWIVGKKRWDFITQENEDEARRLIKDHEASQNQIGDLFANLIQSTTPAMVPDIPADEPLEFGEGEE